MLLKQSFENYMKGYNTRAEKKFTIDGIIVNLVAEFAGLKVYVKNRENGFDELFYFVKDGRSYRLYTQALIVAKIPAISIIISSKQQKRRISRETYHFFGHCIHLFLFLYSRKRFDCFGDQYNWEYYNKLDYCFSTELTQTKGK